MPGSCRFPTGWTRACRVFGRASQTVTLPLWPENFNTTLDVQGPKLIHCQYAGYDLDRAIYSVVPERRLEPFYFQDQTGGQGFHDLLCSPGEAMTEVMMIEVP